MDDHNCVAMTLSRGKALETVAILMDLKEAFSVSAIAGNRYDMTVPSRVLPVLRRAKRELGQRNRQAENEPPAGGVHGHADEPVYEEALREWQRGLIANRLRSHKYSIVAAARSLGWSRSSMYRLVASLGIDVGALRKQSIAPEPFFE